MYRVLFGVLFSLCVLGHINLRGLLTTKNHCCKRTEGVPFDSELVGDKGVPKFTMGISSKVNIIARLKFELPMLSPSSAFFTAPWKSVLFFMGVDA